MGIIILFSIISIFILFISKKFIYYAKRNLFKDQAAWSGNEIKIKYNKSKETSEDKKNENYLKIIAKESKIFLEEHEK